MNRLVIIESPYNSPTADGLIRNRNYLNACIIDSIERGEVPFAAHGFYTQFLNDRIPHARSTGFRLARTFYHYAQRAIFCCDLGESPGMVEGRLFAKKLGLEIEDRLIGMDWDADYKLTKRRR